MEHHLAFFISVTYTVSKQCFGVVLLPAFVVWANTELQQFVSRFSRQVFRREMGVAAIGVCVSMAKQQCEKVTDIIQNEPFTILEPMINLCNALMHSSIQKLSSNNIFSSFF